MLNGLVRLAALCLVSTGVCAATTGPTLGLGTVTEFETVQVPKTPSLVGYGQTFEQKVTFTLDAAANVRVDMREIGLAHWLTEYRSDLRVDGFSLLDSKQQVIGSAAADPGFTGSSITCYSGGKCLGEFARGYTLTSALQAGSYTMRLNGYWDGGRMPELNYGVLVLGVGAPEAYFSALTSVTAIPELSSWVMMAIGLCALTWGTQARRRG